MANKQNKKGIQRPAQPAQRAVQQKPVAKKNNIPKKGLSNVLKIAILLGVIAFAAYANTLKDGYVLDDFNVIKENTIVSRGISAIPEIIATPYRRGWFVTTNDMYRPLSLVMFATEYQLFDKSATASHFFNILFFAGCVIFLFLFLERFFDHKKTAVAFIAALLFALHPIHTEVVANIKSRDEIMCFFFAFLSLNVFLKYTEEGKTKHLALGCLSFFLALMSKETVITFLAIYPLIFFFYKNGNRKQAISITAGAVITAVIFLGIRYSVLSEYHANTSSEVSFIDNMLSAPPSAASGFATEVLILGKYLLLLFVPYPLVCDYSYNSIPFVTLGNIKALLSLVIYLGLAIFGVMRLIKNKKDPFAFTVLYYLITISLFSNIIILIGSPMAERFIFFSSVAFCLAVGLAIDKWLLRTEVSGIELVKSPKVLAVLIPLCLIYSGITIARNTDWQSNYTLFKADVDKAPNDSRLTYYLGTEMATTVADAEKDTAARRKMILQGITELYKSLAVYPDYSSAQSSIGNAYFHIQQYDSAAIHERRALELNPKDAVTINNLAGVYFSTGQYEQAIQMCYKALDLNPQYVNAYANIGLAYMRMRKFDSSLMSLYKAVAVDPTFTTSYENLALTYKAMGQADSAKKYEALSRQKPF